MQLYNKLSANERAQLIEKAGEDRLTLSFYQYAKIVKPYFFRDYLFINLDPLDVLGRIYVASEGINAQLSVHSNKLIEFKKSIDNISLLKGVRLNIAIEHRNDAFLKLKIKIKEKIVADGLETNDYDLSHSGKHVDANEFNQLLDDEETITIDMRNHYESEIGHFKGAELPDVDSFRESLPLIKKKYENFKKNKNILMYCTGGIRCEKASAYLIANGYENVFQLSGGIIEYSREINKNNVENKFIGKNFVFDNRLSERVSAEIISNCHQCGNKSDKHTNCNNEACHLLFIQCEDCAKKYNGCCSKKCEEVYLLPIDQQKKLRKGKRNSNKIFKKGRFNKSIMNKI